MRQVLFVLCVVIFGSITVQSAFAWGHHRHGHAREWHPGPRLIIPPPVYQPAPSYQFYEYHYEVPGYTYTYCTPEQGRPVYDNYGNIIACVRDW